MSENTRLDIDSNIPQQMDKIGKAVDAAAGKLDKFGNNSGSAFDELQRTMKLVNKQFKDFGGTADDAFAKALENVNKLQAPQGIKDVYTKALRSAREGNKLLSEELAKFDDPYLKASKAVEAAQAKLEKAVRGKKSQVQPKLELATATEAKRAIESQMESLRGEAKTLEMFHRDLRDALNREYNEFYLKRQATQQTANLAELQLFKDLGVRLQGEDVALYKKLSDSAKQNASSELENYQKKLQSMDAAQKDADSRMLAMRKDSLARGKALILQAAKDDLEASKAADKQAATDELARYRQKLQAMDATQKDADSRMLAMRKDSLARGKSLILQAAKDDLAASKSIGFSASEAAAKDQGFVNAYNRASEMLAKGQTQRAKTLLDTLNKVKAAAGSTAEMEAAAIKKYGKAYVEAATGSVINDLDRQLKSTLSKYTQDSSTYKSIKAQVAAATSGASGVFSDIGTRQLQLPDFEVLNKSLTNTAGKLPPLLQGFKTLGGRIIDVHSATRGLASGFNLLWLTWGQMGPLFAGAAISMGTKSIVSMGAQIGHQLEIVRVLSEESDSAIAGLNEQLMNIARTGPYGPLQVADALKTLSLAGLSATEVTSALPRVLQFAAAGTTTIEKAAEVMTGVATAFGYTADNFNLVGDIITKTAAVSKAGIEDMGEAFKAASVVSTQFGVSIKDVSLLLALQANLNIKNSAAGTNVRNMYTDLAGRSKEARKLMKELNLELTDSQGRFKDVVTIVKDLDKALSKFTGKGARDAQLALISERGGKPIVAALTAYKTEVREVSVVNGEMVTTVTNQLEQLKKKTEDNYGFMALAAAKLSMTPLKQMESVVSTFQASIATAFQGMEDEVIVSSARLKEIFNSAEFNTAIKNLVIGVAGLTEALLENLDVVGKVILGYVGFKVLATVAGMFLSLHRNVQATTGSLVAYHAAQATAAGANSAAAAAAAASAASAAAVGSNLLKAIPVIGTVVSIGTAAWSMWELYNATQKETANVTKAAADGIKKSGMIEALDAENERLLKQIAMLDMSLKLKRRITEQEFDAIQKSDEAAAAEAKRVNGAIAQAKELEKQEASVRQAAANLAASLYKTMGSEAQNALPVKQLQKQADEIKAVREKINTTPVKTELEFKVDRHKTTSNIVSDMEEGLNKVIRETQTQGTKIFDPDAANRSARSVVSAIEKQISAVTKAGNAQLGELKSNYELSKDLLDAKHKAGIVSEGEYQAELIKQTAIGEAQQLKAISDTEAKLKPLYKDALNKYKEGTEEYAALDEKRVADFEALETKRVEITNAANKRQQLAYIDHQTALLKAQKDTDKYFADLTVERNKQSTLESLNRKYESVTDKSVMWLQAEKAGAIAAAEALSKHEAKLRDDQKAYEDVVKTEKDLQEALRKNEEAGIMAPGVPEAVARAAELRVAAEKNLAKTRLLINEDVANQSAQAYEEAFRKRFSDLKNGLADALSTAMFDGGADGGKQLRKLLEAELRAPFTLLFRLSIDALTGSISEALGAAGSAGGSSGGLSSAFSALSSASTLNTAYKALSGAVEGSIGKSFEKFATSSWGQSLGLSTPAGSNYALSGTGSSLSSMGGGSGLTVGGSTGLQSSGSVGLQASAESASSSLTSLGSTVKQIGTSMAAAFAGQALRKGISGGYSIGGTGETVMDIAALIAGFDPTGITSIITGAVSGLINRTFGRKLKDTGIQGTFGNSEFKGENYQFYKGGWLRSDKTKTSALDQDTTNTLTNTFRAMQASTAVLATNMGLSAKAALEFQKEIKISLKDLTPEQQSEELQKMFNDMQEEMATAVLDAWGDWSLIAKYGETASEVLTTVSNNLTGFNGMLEMLDLRLIDLTMNGAAAASAVIEAAGGVDQLTGMYSGYYESFYSEAERNSKAVETLESKFAKLGITFPSLTKDANGFVTNGEAARDTFRELVTAAANAGNITLATELVKLSADFANIAPVVAKTREVLDGLKQSSKELEAQLLKAQGNMEGYAAAVRAIETVGMTAIELATYDYNKTLEKSIELLGQADEARTTAAEAEIRLLQAQGFETAALAKQRELDVKGLSEAQVAAYDYAAAIDRQITAMEKLSAAQADIAAADIKLLQAQGNAALAAAKQRELDTKSMTRAEIAAYDYSRAIDEQVSKLEKASDIVSKLGSVSSDLGEYLKGFGGDTANSFYKTIGEALSGDLEAMGRVTSEADAAIETAKRTSRSSSEFALKQANVLAKVGQVKAFADKLSKETDTEKIIAAIKGDTNTSKSVDELGTRLSSNDIAVSLNATLETVKKSPIAETEIAVISTLFNRMKATVTGMSLTAQASTSGQTILTMFDSMRATVLAVSMTAPTSETSKVTSAFSSLTAFVTKIQASNLNASSAQTALGAAANVTANINKLVASGLTSSSAQSALSTLANISAYINAISVKPGNTLSAQFQSELAAYSSISANISTINTSSGIVEARKQALVQSLSALAANINAISVSTGVSEARKTSLNQTFSNISAAITTINVAAGLEDKTVAKVSDALDSFQAIISSIAISGADSNIKDLLLGNADDLSYGLSLAAAVESGAGTFGLSAEQVKNLLASSDTIKKTLSVVSGTDAQLTAAQQEAYANTRTAISKALSVTSGTDGALTEAQKAVLENASNSITKALAVKAGTDGALTDAQKTVLANASTSLTKLLAVASGKDETLTAAQQSVLSGVSSSVVKTLAVKAGTDGTLTTAQQQAFANASTSISKSVSVVRGTDATNLTDAQKVLLGILGGTSDGKVSVGGAVDYKPSSELDDLMSNLSDALGRVGIEKMTTELGRLTAAIGQMLAKTEAEKKLADAQRAGADIAAKKSGVMSTATVSVNKLTDLAKTYGLSFNREGSPIDYLGNLDVGYNWKGASGSTIADFLAKAKSLGLFAEQYSYAVSRDDYNNLLAQARKAVTDLGGTPQFATGGYTGPGGINEFAGVVHKGEVVWSQADIANAGGVDVVEAMRKGFMPYAADVPAPDVTYNTSQSTINLDNSALLEELQALREAVANLSYETRAVAVNTGKAAKHLKEFDDRGMKVKNSDGDTLEVTTV